MRFQLAALLTLSGLVAVLGKSVELQSSDAENLYWVDLYDPNPNFGYLCGSDRATYSDDDCPFIDDPTWSATVSVDNCKERCNEMNKNWKRAEDPVPPCTSIAFDELASECALRRCKIFSVMIAENSSTHDEMGEKYDRYKNNKKEKKPIQDFFLNLFDPAGDSKCYPGEMLRRVTEREHHQNPGSYVCEFDGTSEYKTDLPNPGADNPDYRETLPPDYVWDSGLPTFDGCWEGMNDATMNDKYLTYTFSVRLDYKWQQHYLQYEEEFKRHGYDAGLESSIQIVFDQVSWLFRKQFQINLKYSRVALQNKDDSWPENPWRPGDAGNILFTGDWNGGGGLNQMCTSKDILVGTTLFVENEENPEYPLYDFNNAITLAHELMHHMGHGHNGVNMPDIMTGDGVLSYRRCNDPERPGQKKVCDYKSFLSFANVDQRQKYGVDMCNHIRSEQAQCCAVVEHMDVQSHSLLNMSAQSAKACVLEASLCPSGERCKYKGGGTDSGYDDNGGDYTCGDGYNFMMRERDELDPSVFNKASRDACMEALADMQSMGIDVRFDPNSCPIHLYDKPAGCYIMCSDDGDGLVGYFNENAYNYIENKYNDAEPLCISPSVTKAPTNAPDLPQTLIPTDQPQLTTTQPTKQPTKAPTNRGSCVDDSTFEKSSKNCDKFLKKKKKRSVNCLKKYKDNKLVEEFCPKLCKKEQW